MITYLKDDEKESFRLKIVEGKKGGEATGVKNKGMDTWSSLSQASFCLVAVMAKSISCIGSGL